jgi:hypothetical protein
MRTSILAMKTKVRLKAISSRRERARQPFSLHTSTATQTKVKVDLQAAIYIPEFNVSSHTVV